MYTPSLPPRRNENPPRTTHLHPATTDLRSFEDATLFQMFLNGRHLAYETIINDLTERLAKLEALNLQLATDVFRILSEGQIEATKEIIEYLTKLQKEIP